MFRSHCQALTEQQRRARNLVDQRKCPHCDGAIPLLDAISMVRGHGYRFHVVVLLPTGKTVTVEERDFNPQTMLWADAMTD